MFWEGCVSIELKSLCELNDLKFDDIIDVRSPSEFEQDHIPGAINLPVLNDEERARVGTIYVQECSFKARKIGAALVSKNAAKHLEQTLMEKEGDWRPLVYCWRGGQRSGSFTAILSQIGWRAETLKGGYKSYRRLVVDLLHEGEIDREIVLIDGNTGTAKTDILLELKSLGLDVLDLEGLARHRGSLLGGMKQAQPAQPAFESAIAGQLCQQIDKRPLVLEAESSKVGDRLIPPSLWKAMKAAPRIRVSAPIDARAEYLVRAYDDLVSDKQKLLDTLDQLKRHHSKKKINHWKTLVANEQHVELARELMSDHYDPRYRKVPSNVLEEFELEDLSVDAIKQAAARIESVIGPK